MVQLRGFWGIFSLEEHLAILGTNVGNFVSMGILGNFRFDYAYDYRYEIRQLRANCVIFCCRESGFRQEVVAAAALSTRFSENPVVHTTS
jgi:hypothetical protein